jgi:hypothetical protein
MTLRKYTSSLLLKSGSAEVNHSFSSDKILQAVPLWFIVEPEVHYWVIMTLIRAMKMLLLQLSTMPPGSIVTFYGPDPPHLTIQRMVLDQRPRVRAIPPATEGGQHTGAVSGNRLY